MAQVHYVVFALFLISLALTAVFYLSWRAFDRQQHVLTWTWAFACASLQWFLNVLAGFSWMPFSAYWIPANYLGAIVPVLSIVGFQQRAGVPALSPLACAALAATPFLITMSATYIAPHAGVMTSSLTLFSMFTSLWVAGILWAPRRSKRAIEWAAIICHLAYAINQLVLGSIGLSQGPFRDDDTVSLYVSGLFLTLPTFFTAIGLLILLIIASDLALKAQRLARREETLRREDSARSWETLLDVIEAIPDPVAIANNRLSLVACNSTFSELLELSKEECCGDKPIDLVAFCRSNLSTVEGQEVRSEFKAREMFAHALASGDRLEVVTKAGRIYMLGCGHLRSGDQIVVASDVSQLYDAKQRLESAIHSMPLGFALFDKNNRVIACNSSYEKLLRKSRDWIMSRSFETLIDAGVARLDRKEPETLRQAGHEGLRDAIRDRRHFSRTALFDDGSWYDLTIQPIADGGFVTIARDITKRRLLEIELERSEAQLREVLGNQPFPVAVIRKRDERFVFCSKAAARVLKLDHESGEQDASFFSHSKQQATDPVFGSIPKTGTTIQEVSYERANGDRFPALTSALDTKFSGEEATVVSFIDISNIKEMQRELATQREALYQSEKLNALGTLLAGVAHELNNPLTIITTNSHVLLSQSPDSEASRRLRNITDAADRCAKIIRSFLDMARKSTHERVPFDAAACIEQALDISNLGYSLHDVTVTSTVDADLPRVLGNADQFSQAILNLVVNAKQALAEQAPPRLISIAAALDSQGSFLLIDVKDNGPGIPPEQADHVFEPFFTTKAVGEGTGMGLSLVRGIVRSHGGTIRLMPSQKPGCHFQIKLPVFEEVEHTRDAASSPQEQVEPKRILVVDDEEKVLKALEDVLSLDGHSVRSVKSAKGALAALEQSEYDVLISDIRMPVMNGEELYRCIQDRFPEMLNKTAFITGNNVSGPALEFLESTNCPYLGKPFLPEEISHLVRTVCRASDS